jgi:hypothetical protein
LGEANNLGRKSWLLTVVFLGALGFPLGVLCLFYVNIPLEAMMKDRMVAQVYINIAMSAIILIYVGIVVMVTVLFHRKIAARSEMHRRAIVLLVFLTACSGGIFYMLLTTDNSVVKAWQGTSLQQNGKFVIGPYPEEVRLIQLKKEGFQGVISLLSPTIPFENILLEREIQAGEKIGLRVYSFPMLPWISGNENSLNGIKELVGKEKGPFYIHCYLGKHRADLVITTLTGEIKTYLYPDRLENGRLYYYQEGRIIMGPFPDDEEWFHLVKRGQVKEVISFLDPDIPEEARLIEKEKNICTESCIDLKIVTMRFQDDKLGGLSELLDLVNATPNKVFIHGYQSINRSRLIDASLKSGTAVSTATGFPEQFSGGKVYPVHPALILGPVPGAIESDSLKNLGYNSFNISQESDMVPPAIAGKILSHVEGNKGAFYISGFKTEQQMELIRNILVARMYGIESIDIKISNQTVTKMGRYLFIGLMPGQEELKALASLGINTVVYPQKANAKLDNTLSQFQNTVEDMGLNLQTVFYEPGNATGIIAIASRDNNPCYVVSDSRERAEMAQDIDAARLFYKPNQQ